MNKNYLFIAALLAPSVSLVLLSLVVWAYHFPMLTVIFIFLLVSSMLAAYGLLLLSDEISKRRKM
jgi:hypothetical protein